jgi:hypothetical protein
MDSLLVRAHRRSLVSRESFRETLHTQAANTGVAPSDSIRPVQMILRPYFGQAQERWVGSDIQTRALHSPRNPCCTYRISSLS